MEVLWFREVSKDSDVVISTRVRFARNIQGFRFPNAMGEEEADRVIQIVKNAVNHKDFHVFENCDIEYTNLGSLIEQHVISKEFLEVENGAIVLNDDHSLVTMVNEEDHLRIQSFQSGLNIDLAYEKLCEFTDALNQKIPFAVSDKYGYLTACPTNVGSGMRVSVMLHLPALAKLGLLAELFDQVSSIGVSIRGIYGENTKGLGDMYQISNKKTLGISDEYIISSIKAVITTIVEQERKAREMLKNNNLFLEDDIFRAYGILKYARIISDEEALEQLSKLRLGCSMGIVDTVSLDKVQSLMVDTMENTLKTILKENYTKEEEDEKRGEYIREELK